MGAESALMGAEKMSMSGAHGCGQCPWVALMGAERVHDWHSWVHGWHSWVLKVFMSGSHGC